MNTTYPRIHRGSCAPSVYPARKDVADFHDWFKIVCELNVRETGWQGWLNGSVEAKVYAEYLRLYLEGRTPQDAIIEMW